MILLNHKQILRDTLLPLSVLLALFRLDWDPFEHQVNMPEFHDIIVGQSVALTETNFHNWYNAYDNGHHHPKSINSSFHSSVFQELHSLYQDRNRTLNHLRRQRTEIITLLLDHQESRNSLPSHSFQNFPVSNDNNNHNEDINHNIIESPDVDEQEGAAGPLDFNSQDVLSPEDINMIEMLWAQDIDMGVSRNDSNPFKSELHFEKQKVVEETEKPQDNWEYSIDGETGEYMPIQPQPPQQELNMQVSPEPDPDLSFADCLQLLNDFEGLPDTEMTTAPQQPLITTQDIEQRWQDLADSIPELLSAPSQFQNTSWNQSSGSNQDVFAFNATTNGNVNLQNATDRSLPSFGNNSQQLNNSQFLTIDTHDSQLFLSSQALNNESDLFSPINRFNNMNLNASPQPPIPSTTELTNMLFPDQQQQPYSEVDTGLPQEITADLNREQQPAQNGSLLLDLLNSPADAQSELEEQEENLSNLLEEIGDEEESVMDFMSDDNSSFADSDEVLEGATGISLDRDLLKLGESKDIYRRGGASPCESESGSTSSFEYHGSSQKFSENIQHNHTYSSSSESNAHQSSRSSNNSYNGSSEEEQEYRNRPSRDERRAKALNIPIPVEKIINLPVDSFNELIKKYDLNDAQMQMIRDIRRRGKNKVAAQNCRKRKISAISIVEKTVYGMQSEHEKLLKERDKIHNDMYIMQRKYEDLYHQIFQNMRDINGQRVDPDQYQLEVMDDGSVIIVPKNGSSNSTFHGN